MELVETAPMEDASGVGPTIGDLLGEIESARLHHGLLPRTDPQTGRMLNIETESERLATAGRAVDQI